MALPDDTDTGSARVLTRLTATIRDLAADSHLGVRLVEAGGADGADGALLVDAAGTLVGEVDVGTVRDRATPAVLALLDAYGFVLEAEHARRQAEQRQEKLERDARTDPLTGLLNRRGWDEAVAREQARTARSQRGVGVVVVDLDGLKATNDAHGHLAGDLLLRLAARVLQGVVRASDVVARIGGDEFALLLVEETDGGVDVAVGRIEAAFAAEGLGASVGGSVQAPGQDLREVFHAADLAMYARKPGRA